MSMLERFIYWTAIVVLVVAFWGLHIKISKLEAQATQVSAQVEE